MWRQQQRQSAVSSSDWVVDILWIPICASGVTSSAEWCIKYISGTIAYEALCFTFHVNIYEYRVPRVYSLSVGSIGNILYSEDANTSQFVKNSWSLSNSWAVRPNEKELVPGATSSLGKRASRRVVLVLNCWTSRYAERRKRGHQAGRSQRLTFESRTASKKKYTPHLKIVRITSTYPQAYMYSNKLYFIV